MELTITGADGSDRGPSGCVVRFMTASAAGDAEAAMAEVHPDCREGLSGAPHAPPGVVAVEVLAAEPGEDRVLVPTRLVGGDGTEQRFVFAVRPHADGCGIDLPASMEATFGGDPAQLVEQALRAAVEPLAEGFAQLGEALGGGAGGAPAARRIAVDGPLPEATASLPEQLTAHVLELDLHQRRRREELQSEWQSAAELNVRLAFALDPAWTSASVHTALSSWSWHRRAMWPRTTGIGFQAVGASRRSDSAGRAVSSACSCT